MYVFLIFFSIDLTCVIYPEINIFVLSCLSCLSNIECAYFSGMKNHRSVLRQN